MNIGDILETLEKLEQAFPRKKIPNYIYTNNTTFDRLKECMTPISIIAGVTNFAGLPIYVRNIPDRIIRIYNLDNELMQEIILED